MAKQFVWLSSCGIRISRTREASCRVYVLYIELQFRAACRLLLCRKRVDSRPTSKGYSGNKLVRGARMGFHQLCQGNNTTPPSFTGLSLTLTLPLRNLEIINLVSSPAACGVVKSVWKEAMSGHLREMSGRRPGDEGRSLHGEGWLHARCHSSSHALFTPQRVYWLDPSVARLRAGLNKVMAGTIPQTCQRIWSEQDQSSSPSSSSESEP